ncbi:MAG: PucC family protein, partial [Pseudomonadota bacterium]
LFAVATMIEAMSLPVTERSGRGLALGAWGAAQATAAGLGVLLGGGLRDVVSSAAVSGAFGDMLTSVSVGYSFVWHAEIALLIITLVMIAPLVGRPGEGAGGGGAGEGRAERSGDAAARPVGLTDFPT